MTTKTISAVIIVICSIVFFLPTKSISKGPIIIKVEPEKGQSTKAPFYISKSIGFNGKKGMETGFLHKENGRDRFTIDDGFCFPIFINGSFTDALALGAFQIDDNGCWEVRRQSTGDWIDIRGRCIIYKEPLHPKK